MFLSGLLRFGIFLLVVIFGFVVFIFRHDISQRAQQYKAINDIETENAKGHWVNTGALLKKAVQVWPNEPQFQLKMAHWYHVHRQYAEARVHYERGLALHPTAHRYRYDYARLLTQQREINRAIAMYQQVLNNQPSDHGAMADLGHLYRFAGNRADTLGAQKERQQFWAWARYYFSKSLQREPRSAKAWFGLGDILQKQNRHAAASACYCQLIHRYPNVADAWFHLGLSQWYMGHSQRGMGLMQWAVQSDEDESPERFASRQRLITALRQQYYMHHHKIINAVHWDELAIHRLNHPEETKPAKPLTDEDFPKDVLEACSGWQAPNLAVKRPLGRF
jgi:tetratricopeptide (TPR) repeat protein